MRRADQRGLEIRRDELRKRGLDTFAVDAALAQPVELGCENPELPGDAEMWATIEGLNGPLESKWDKGVCDVCSKEIKRGAANDGSSSLANH